MNFGNLNPGLPKARGPAPTVFCYICGRQFGSKRYSKHLNIAPGFVFSEIEAPFSALRIIEIELFL